MPGKKPTTPVKPTSGKVRKPKSGGDALGYLLDVAGITVSGEEMRQLQAKLQDVGTTSRFLRGVDARGCLPALGFRHQPRTKP